MQLPSPEVLSIRPESTGVLLVRWRLDGTFCGDTWHSTLEDAFEQVGEEFPTLRPVWHDIDVAENAVAFALRRVSELDLDCQ